MSAWAVWLTEAEWAWQDDANVVAVLAHLLGTAATATRCYRYETLARGDALTTHAALAYATGLTVKQVRLALAKLEGVGVLCVGLQQRCQQLHSGATQGKGRSLWSNQTVGSSAF